jgi:hypothetical protein
MVPHCVVFIHGLQEFLVHGKKHAKPVWNVVNLVHQNPSHLFRGCMINRVFNGCALNLVGTNHQDIRIPKHLKWHQAPPLLLKFNKGVLLVVVQVVVDDE